MNSYGMCSKWLPKLNLLEEKIFALSTRTVTDHNEFFKKIDSFYQEILLSNFKHVY